MLVHCLCIRWMYNLSKHLNRLLHGVLTRWIILTPWYYMYIIIDVIYISHPFSFFFLLFFNEYY